MIGYKICCSILFPEGKLDTLSVPRWTAVGVRQPHLFKFTLSIHRRTLMTDRRPLDGPSCTIVDGVKTLTYDFLYNKYKCAVTDSRPVDNPTCTTVDGVRTFVSDIFVISFNCPAKDPHDGPSAFNGPSCTTVDGVKTFVSNIFIISFKCPAMDTYDGPSSLRRSILHSHRWCQNLCLWHFYNFF